MVTDGNLDYCKEHGKKFILATEEAARPVENFNAFYMSPIDYSGRGAKSQWIEKMLQTMALSQLILYNRIKGGDEEGESQEIHWWWMKGAGEEAGKSMGWIRSKMEGHRLLLHWWVQGS